MHLKHVTAAKTGYSVADPHIHVRTLVSALIIHRHENSQERSKWLATRSLLPEQGIEKKSVPLERYENTVVEGVGCPFSLQREMPKRLLILASVTTRK